MKKMTIMDCLDIFKKYDNMGFVIEVVDGVNASEDAWFKKIRPLEKTKEE